MQRKRSRIQDQDRRERQIGRLLVAKRQAIRLRLLRGGAGRIGSQRSANRGKVPAEHVIVGCPFKSARNRHRHATLGHESMQQWNLHWLAAARHSLPGGGPFTTANWPQLKAIASENRRTQTSKGRTPIKRSGVTATTSDWADGFCDRNFSRKSCRPVA